MDHGIESSLSAHDFSVLALRRCLGSIQRLRESGERNARSFQKLQPSPLLRHRTRAELAREVVRETEALLKEYPDLAELRRVPEVRDRLGSIADRLERAEGGLEALGAFDALVELEHDLFEGTAEPADRRAHLTADAHRVHLKVDANGLVDRPVLKAALAGDERNRQILAVGTSESMRIRDERRRPRTDEQILFEICHELLDRGASLPTSYRSLGTSGFRDHQTCLSLADPGPGHLAVTARERDLLRGTVVHVEHIDRDGIDDKEVVEAYRLPAARNAARVRFAIGDAAPVTAYIGRPVFENLRTAGGKPEPSESFGIDLLKSAHMTASACSAMFANGIADCKIAIERMTAAQALDFMRAVAGNVLRDRYLQRLSAAFNIHTPILDDRSDEQERVVREPFEIAQLGVQLASSGGFEKVTWDGASDKVPSLPFTEQLSHEQLVTVIHRAHELGLETYISAGMKGEHMRPATHAGVGGVGIGTSLHHRDAGTGLMGALRPESIQEVLRIRDEAEQEPLGRAARLLARLDRMHSEGSLPEANQGHREDLFAALRAADVPRCEALRTELRALEQLENDHDHPLIESTRRVLAALRASRRRRDLLDVGPDRESRLARALEERDLARLEELA